MLADKTAQDIRGRIPKLLMCAHGVNILNNESKVLAYDQSYCEMQKYPRVIFKPQPMNNRM